jgi:N-glycosylase/DNA lyase
VVEDAVRVPTTTDCLTAAAASHLHLEDAWRACGDLFVDFVERQPPPTHDHVERELLFCLLGGFGVSYEHNLSAAEIVGGMRPFASTDSDDELFTLVASALETPQFRPPRGDGTLRRYRFPRRKALLLVEARAWLREQRPLYERLIALASAQERRDFLRRCPGVGPKTSSWLLRNLCLGDDLAIIDVHLLRALQVAGRISSPRLPRDYEAVEDAFLAWCKELEAPPAAFDLFVWEWQRGTLAPR